MTPREMFVRWVRDQRGKPYVWGAKGEQFLVGGRVKTECFDCSGLVTRGLVLAGYPAVCPLCHLDLCGFHGTQRLFNELEPTASPHAGDLMFYGSGPMRISHVMVYLDATSCVGASGGNRDSKDPLVSISRGQKVKFQAANYRNDLVGYRALPLP
jgi:cell wall-associated NlpC family hydrolase